MSIIVLAGGGDDCLDGGPGIDLLYAGAGNDTVDARDGILDYVDCGTGDDTAIVDRIDIVRGCEHVH